MLHTVRLLAAPVFEDVFFEFVPFPCRDPGNEFMRNYPQACVPFVKHAVLTHDDPDSGGTSLMEMIALT